MEIATGVYVFTQTIEADGTQKTVHPAAVETRWGLVLVDTGYPELSGQIESNLQAAGFEWTDVAGVLLTHHDTDHAGSLATVVNRTEAVVFAHERAAPYIDGREEPIKSPDGQRYPAAPVNVELVDAVSFQTRAGPMDVVFTPGHAPGHVSLHLPESSLVIAGDALTVDNDCLQGPNRAYTLDMAEAYDSVDRLAALDFERTLCYHGGAVDAGADRVVELREDG
jgi:glyoxylase-like metal-dependent hydrolase (beta-lactamase superfamily II)